MNKPTFEEAKKEYVNRFTMEHIPDWAKKSHEGMYYAPQHATCLDWYNSADFDESGCYSKSTWPLGEGFLDEPFHLNRNQKAGPLILSAMDIIGRLANGEKIYYKDFSDFYEVDSVTITSGFYSLKLKNGRKFGSISLEEKIFSLSMGDV